jgi:hypothetical protein
LFCFFSHENAENVLIVRKLKNIVKLKDNLPAFSACGIFRPWNLFLQSLDQNLQMSVGEGVWKEFVGGGVRGKGVIEHWTLDSVIPYQGVRKGSWWS